MKILVVGGAGYVGGAITDLLSKKNKKYNVIVYDNLLYEETYLKECDFVNGDIRDKKKILPYLKWADVVIWAAALVGDGACSINPDLTFDINLKTIKFLVKNFNRKIIFFSTCSVYGAQDGILNENSLTKPLSVYANSKLMAEKLLIRKNAIIFRLGTLFGIADKFSRIRLDLVVNTLVAKALQLRKISVFGGDQYRPLLHVKDVARAVELAIKSKKRGIYNLHYYNAVIHEIATKIKKYFKNVKILKVNMKFEDLRNYRVNSDKVKKDLKFKPIYNLDYGIRELIAILKEKRIKDINNPRYTNQIYLNKFIDYLK
jgi:nucleoside-diphosphate-sugar epimerase